MAETVLRSKSLPNRGVAKVTGETDGVILQAWAIVTSGSGKVRTVISITKP